MSKVTVYSKPNCVQCEQTKKFLDRKGVDYTVVDLTEDAEALSKVKSLGFSSAPIVETEHDTWAGFNPMKLNSIKA